MHLVSYCSFPKHRYINIVNYCSFPKHRSVPTIAMHSLPKRVLPPALAMIRVVQFSGVNLVWNLGGSSPKQSIFPGKFLKIFDFFQAILPKNFNFFRQISEKSQFHQTISIFPHKFPKNFCFSGNFKKNSSFQAKIGHLQLLLGKLFYLSSKVTTLEHIPCTW